MKPNTTKDMHRLIVQIKDALPFNEIDSNFCSDVCTGCSVKLISFIEIEIDNWEYKLNKGKVPNFKDINKLANTAKKIRAVLLKNKLI